MDDPLVPLTESSGRYRRTLEVNNRETARALAAEALASLGWRRRDIAGEM